MPARHHIYNCKRGKAAHDGRNNGVSVSPYFPTGSPPASAPFPPAPANPDLVLILSALTTGLEPRLTSVLPLPPLFPPTKHLELILGAVTAGFNPSSTSVCSTAFCSRGACATCAMICAVVATVHALRNQTPGLGCAHTGGGKGSRGRRGAVREDRKAA